jgi:type IV secretion system protein VirB8
VCIVARAESRLRSFPAPDQSSAADCASFSQPQGSIMSKDAALEAYLAEAASWDADRVGQIRRSARTAWIVAIIAIFSAVMSAVAIMCLTPLKQVVPFLVRVDNSTGVVDVVPPYDGRSGLTETITRYLLTHYINDCERFVWATAEADYEECAAFHSAARNQAWAARWATTNPDSPLNRYKDGTTVRAEVKSVSFFKRATGLQDLAQVRYLKAARRGEGGAEQITHWIANIQYAYVAASGDARVRRWNPLGLRVVEFHVEPEVVGEATPPAPAGTSNPPGAKP